MILLLIIILFIAAPAQGQPDVYRTDYSDHWIVYDNDINRFVSASNERTDHRTIHFFVNLISEKGKKFELCSEDEISLFINGKIVLNKERSGCMIMDIDSLYQRHEMDSLQFSVYKTEKDNQIRTSVLYPALGFVPQEDLAKVRSISTVEDYIIISLMVMALVLLLIREKFNKFYQEYTSLTKTFALRIRASQLYGLKPFSVEIASVTLILSLGLSFLALLFTRIITEETLMGANLWALEDLLKDWLGLALAFVGVFYLQFFLLYAVNLFFGNQKILFIQFYDNLRITNFYTITVLTVILLFLLVSLDSLVVLGSIMPTLLLVMFLVKSGVIYMKMINQTSHRKLHIFSYFCATEILPVALVIKIVFY